MANLKSLTIDGVSILDFCHPIGSVYTSTDPTDPGDLFGGTWESIIDVDAEPRFLRYGNPNTTNKYKLAAGDQGGKINYELRAAIGACDDNVGSISYLPTSVTDGSKHRGAYAVTGNPVSIGDHMNHHTHVYDCNPLTEAGYTSDWAKNGDPTSIVPPYTVVYGWKRIA